MPTFGSTVYSPTSTFARRYCGSSFGCRVLVLMERRVPELLLFLAVEDLLLMLHPLELEGLVLVYYCPLLLAGKGFVGAKGTFASGVGGGWLRH